MARRRCRNCPEPPATPPPREVTFDGECERLWSLSLYALGNTIELIQGHTTLGLPNAPLPQLQRLHARLGKVIQTWKDHYANRSPSE